MDTEARNPLGPHDLAGRINVVAADLAQPNAGERYRIRRALDDLELLVMEVFQAGLVASEPMTPDGYPIHPAAPADPHRIVTEELLLDHDPLSPDEPDEDDEPDPDLLESVASLVPAPARRPRRRSS